MDGNLINYSMIGKHIKIARKARHMTQEMLAEKMDVSLGYIGQIERGDKLLNLERLAQVCLILQVPIEDMIAGCVDQEKESIPAINVLTQEKVDAIHTLLKGQPGKVVNMVTKVVYDIVTGLDAPENEG
ncbi:MAG TPA: helix-turn-helix transcriptional regulator [Candidatus Pullichristensenella stercorigallinarum]|uniref:Helix-turn-helix transcriptional regulator n=1 Tax=Candidatus Pullichristensenella stercorigallinarum TaxID=2840909 RepID=A0A9D1CXG3_9FIRM|nr:helix-turn-helix transcriptional regulator [Candidatus Pullichristensenella stercorigallinarum]